MASPHTRLCSHDCSLEHNELILALQESMNRADGGANGGKGRIPWETQRKSLDFKRCLDRLLESNWDMNSDVPDPLNQLRYPVVHLCCLFGKPTALEFLINRGFDPSVKSTRTGETALHVTLRFFYNIFHPPRGRIEALNRKTHRLGVTECVAMFEQLLCILTSPNKRVLHLKDCIGRESVFHLAASKRTEASRELLLLKNKEGPFKRGQGDNMRAIKYENERNYYDRCLRLLAEKLDSNAGLEVLRFDTNRRGQTVLDILVQDQSSSAQETLQFLARKFNTLHSVLVSANSYLLPAALHDGEKASSAAASQETREDQDIPDSASQMHPGTSPSNGLELHAPIHSTQQPALPEDTGSQRVDVHDGVMIKIEYDEDEANARTPPTMVQSNSCARQSSRTLRELLTNRGALSGLNVPMVTNSDLASYATSHAISVAQGLHSQAVNPSMAGQCEPSLTGATESNQNWQRTCNASVLSPFLELVIKDGIELDEATHNSIVNAIKRKCAEKMCEIDSKMAALGEQSVSNEKEITERFLLIQRKKTQMDEVRNEIEVLNRQIQTVKNEMERKVELGRVLQMEVCHLEQDLNKTKEFGGALEVKRKQLSDEQKHIKEKLSLCQETKLSLFEGPPQKKSKN